MASVLGGRGGANSRHFFARGRYVSSEIPKMQNTSSISVKKFPLWSCLRTPCTNLALPLHFKTRPVARSGFGGGLFKQKLTFSRAFWQKVDFFACFLGKSGPLVAYSKYIRICNLKNSSIQIILLFQ